MDVGAENITVMGALLGVLGTLMLLIRQHFGRMEAKADKLADEVKDLTVAIRELVTTVTVQRAMTPPVGVPSPNQLGLRLSRDDDGG